MRRLRQFIDVYQQLDLLHVAIFPIQRKITSRLPSSQIQNKGQGKSRDKIIQSAIFLFSQV